MKYLISVTLFLMALTSYADTIVKAKLMKGTEIVVDHISFNKHNFKNEILSFPQMHYRPTLVTLSVEDVISDETKIKDYILKGLNPNTFLVKAYVDIIDYNKMDQTYKMRLTFYNTDHHFYFFSETRKFIVTADFGDGSSSLTTTGKFYKAKNYYEIKKIEAPQDETFKAVLVEDGQTGLFFVTQKDVPVKLRVVTAK